MPKEFTKHQLIEKTDALVRHQTYLARYGAGLSKEITTLFEDGELLSLVKEGGSKATVDKKIATLINRERQETAKRLNKGMRDVADIEIDWMRSIYSLSVKGKVDVNKLITESANFPMVVTNSTIADILENIFERIEEQVVNAAMMFYAEFVSPIELTDLIRASRTQMRNSIDMCVRTMAFNVASNARETAYKANPDAVRGVIMTAVLDGRTTDHCKMIDGKIFKIGEGPRPPFHPRCRTIAMAVMTYDTDDEARQRLEYRTRVGPGKEYTPGDNKAKSTRKNISKGVVDVKQSDRRMKNSATYADFMKSQTTTAVGKEFIRDTIGVTRGNWFIKEVEKGGNAVRILEQAIKMDLNTLDAKGLRSRKNK